MVESTRVWSPVADASGLRRQTGENVRRARRAQRPRNRTSRLICDGIARRAGPSVESTGVVEFLY